MAESLYVQLNPKFEKCRQFSPSASGHQSAKQLTTDDVQN
jgi:hypothetical protein